MTSASNFGRYSSYLFCNCSNCSFRSSNLDNFGCILPLLYSSSIPSPIITYPITITVKSVATNPVLSITDTPNAVVPMSAPPTIRRVVVTFDVFFPRISIPNARKNKIIDDIPKLDIRNGFLSISLVKSHVY